MSPMSSPLLALAAGVMTVLVGLIITARGLVPAPPNLTAAFDAATAAPAGSRTRADTPDAQRVPGLVRVWVRAASAGVAAADLAITGTDRTRHTLEKTTVALIGLALPTVAVGVLAMGGVGVAWVLPAVVGPVLAGIFWLAQDQHLRAKAAARRGEFTAALTAYLALVGLERQVRGSAVEALEEAARISSAWPFVLIHTEVLRAELAGQPPWEGLRDLGTRIGVARLEGLADIVATAQDGAAVFATLMAEAASMRHEQIAAQKAAANVVSEQLTQPVAVMFFGYLLFMLVPAMLRIATL